jgi:hypothetical protein
MSPHGARGRLDAGAGCQTVGRAVTTSVRRGRTYERGATPGCGRRVPGAAAGRDGGPAGRRLHTQAGRAGTSAARPAGAGVQPARRPQPGLRRGTDRGAGGAAHRGTPDRAAGRRRPVFRPLATRKQLEFTVRVAPDVPEILHTDEQRLQQGGAQPVVQRGEVHPRRRGRAGGAAGRTGRGERATTGPGAGQDRVRGAGHRDRYRRTNWR